MPTKPTPVRENAYYADGSIQWRGFKMDGEMHGEWEFYRKDGSLMRAGPFERGRQVGSWRTFDRSGRLVKETEFTAAESGVSRSAGGSEGSSDKPRQPPGVPSPRRQEP